MPTRSITQKRLEMVAIGILFVAVLLFGMENYREYRARVAREEEASGQEAKLHAQKMATVASPPAVIVPRGEPPFPFAENTVENVPRTVSIVGHLSNGVQATGVPVALLYLAGDQSDYQVWDLEACRKRCSLKVPAVVSEKEVPGTAGKKVLSGFRKLYCDSFCFSADGIRIAASYGPAPDQENTIVVWDTTSGEIVFRDHEPSREVLGIRFIDQDMIIVFAIVNSHRLFQRVNVREGSTTVIDAEMYKLEGNPFDANPQSIAIRDYDRLLVFSLPDGNPLEVSMTSPNHKEPVREILLSADSRHLVMTYNSGYEKWNLGNGRLEKCIEFPKTKAYYYPSLLSSATKHFIIPDAQPGYTVVYDVATGERLCAIGYPTDYSLDFVSVDRQSVVLKHQKSGKVAVVRYPQPFMLQKTTDITLE